ncbi:MAG: HEAT repeat domain-containing protein [Syntrophobacteraceae bacterium]
MFLLVMGVAWAEQNSPAQTYKLIENLKAKDNTVRRDAADALLKLGPAAVFALGAALGGKDDDLASASAVLLGEIGPPSIPVLAKVLNDKRFLFNPRRIKDVVSALGSIGSDAVPVMVEATADKNGFNARTLLIMKALNEVGPLAIPGLIKSLNDSLPARRFAVTVVLRDLNDATTVPAFIMLLQDEYREIRALAATSLQRLGPKVKAAVPPLIKAVEGSDLNSVKKAESLKWEPYVNFRGAAVAALGAIAPESDEVLATFIKALRDEDPEVRSAAASALGQMGRRAGTAVSPLLKALKDVNGQVRKEVVGALGKITPKPEDVLSDLTEALNDRNPAVRGEVATAFGRMREESKTVVPILIRLLDDTNGNVRIAATNALGQLGREAKSAVPLLVSALKDRDNRVRRNAVKALASMGPSAKDAVPSLIEYLKNEVGDDQREAANALRQIGSPAISPLVGALQEKDPMIRQCAAQALGQIEPKTEEAVLALAGALRDKNPLVRKEVAIALRNIGPKAKASVPALCEALEDEDESIRIQAVSALGGIGSEARVAVSALIEALNGKDLELRRAAASALGGIGPEGEGSVAALIRALKDDNSGVRRAATNSLGQIGPAARPSIPALIEALNDDTDIRDVAADALVDIATGLQDASAADSIEELKRVHGALMAKPNLQTRKHAKYEHAKSVNRTIEHLKLIWWKEATGRLANWSSEHPMVVVVCILYLLWVSVWTAIFFIWPLGLLPVNRTFAPFEVRLPPYLLGMNLSLRHFLWVGFINYRLRVLDAWVKAHSESVRKRFAEKETVSYRQVHINMPVTIDGSVITELAGKHLRAPFENHIGCLLIWGEGGSGKTSLACQVAKWAMAEEQDLRISKHQMLPVLIEEELDSEASGVSDILTDVIRRQLQILCDEPTPISEELLDHLLRRQRLLVIIDRISEMSTTSQAKVQPGASHFSSNALIVTSRLNEELGGIPKTVIKPLRIAGNRLSSFMENYLTQRNKRELFTDAAFFNACGKLSEMVGDREATVLLAKLYAEKMIHVQEAESGEELPNTIPDLMIDYLNEINRGVTEGKLDDRTVHRDAQTIAWECLRQNYRPTHARISDVLAKLTGNDAPNRLKYLEGRLRLIQTIQPAQDRVRFLLDPLAEYLAGLYLIDTNADSEEKWREFLSYGTQAPGTPVAIRGFLLAVRDCCIAKHADKFIPNFVVDELNVQVRLGSQLGA